MFLKRSFFITNINFEERVVLNAKNYLCHVLKGNICLFYDLYVRFFF